MPPFPSSVSRDNHYYKASPLARTLTPPPASFLSGPAPFPSIESIHHNHILPNSHHRNSNINNNISMDSTRSAHSSATSGQNFHISSSGLSMSNSSEAAASPTYHIQHSHPISGLVQIYCANCRRLSALRECYACTECISGFCSDCVYTLSSAPGGRGRLCPRCGVDGARYKPFQLDIR